MTDERITSSSDPQDPLAQLFAEANQLAQAYQNPEFVAHVMTEFDARKTRQQRGLVRVIKYSRAAALIVMVVLLPFCVPAIIGLQTGQSEWQTSPDFYAITLPLLLAFVTSTIGLVLMPLFSRRP